MILGTRYQRGKEAVSKILHQAQPIGKTERSNLYQKVGDFKTAVADFVSVNPKRVRLNTEDYAVKCVNLSYESTWVLKDFKSIC